MANFALLAGIERGRLAIPGGLSFVDYYFNDGRLWDMSGNVWEWTIPADNAPADKERSSAIIRGGSYREGENAIELKSTMRKRLVTSWHNADLGFRCAK